jgi:outer membrane protein insertion porin family
MSRRTTLLLAALTLMALPWAAASQTQQQAQPAAPAAPQVEAPAAQAPAPAATQGPVKIEKIVLDGNDRLTQDAFLALTSLRPGEVYSEERLRQEYTKIWASGLLEDLTVEVTDGKAGKIVTFHIKERPIISSVEYTGSKSLTQSTNLDKLKENNADIKTGTVLDYTKIKRTEAALRFMAADKGFADATVTTKVQNMGRSAVAVTFNIAEGPKTRIEKVLFLNQKVYSQMKLRYTMKKTRQHWFLSWATRHDIYSESRYYEDIKLVRDLFESNGYLDVDIGDPIIDSHYDKNRSHKWLTLSVPIEPGVSYKLGTVSFEGNQVFSEPDLRRAFRLKQGAVLNKVALGYVIKAIESMYGVKGYIYATATPIFDKDAKTGICNLSISITEDQIYYVNHIDFYGNSQTRDYVLRRNMLVYEQEVLNYAQYQTGLYQLKQTGIFEIKEDPVITKVPNTNTVNIAVKGTEANKNELLFGGGYGGVNGFFVSGSFRTYNFMGMGTTVSVNADVGKYQQLFGVNYSDPWMFGHRIGGSISLFNRKMVYLQFDQKSLGGQASLTFPIGNFAYWQVGLLHDRSSIDNIQGTAAANQAYVASLNNSVTSALTAAIGFNTVNNPFRPTRGMSASINAMIAGTLLGGQNKYYKPTGQFSIFIPTFRKQNLAFRLQGGFLAAYGGDQIPIWERYFLGGEDSLRGFAVRSVYPEVEVTSKKGNKYYRYFLDPSTGTIEGGNRYYLLNSEYVFHVVEQVDVAAFIDVGNTYNERQKFELSNYRADAGIEVRFFIPTFNVPLRLIWANNINPRPNDDFSRFQFSIGLTF